MADLGAIEAPRCRSMSARVCRSDRALAYRLLIGSPTRAENLLIHSKSGVYSISADRDTAG
jgi:hypothetical protein